MSAEASTPAGRQALALLNKAHFLRSVTQTTNLPEDSRAEVAFVGRSNAGKSSAINAIVNQNRLAFVSKQPGRTRELNYFQLDEGRYLVDLPGYGYAAASRDLRESWDRVIGDYLLHRAPLAGIVLIMDIRVAPTPLDQQFLEWLKPARRRVHVLLTKCDKLGRGARMQALRKFQAHMQAHASYLSAQLFSSLSNEGLDEARVTVEQLLSGGLEHPAEK